MSGIPVSTIVAVNISVGAAFPQKSGFGTLLIVTNETGVVGAAERIRFYSDADSVSTDWGAMSEASAAAAAYFSQQPKPLQLAIATRFEADQAAELRGGSNAETVIPTWAAITNPTFTISIDGVEEDIAAGTMAAVTDMDDVADVIETALQAVAAGGYTLATCTWDGSRFFIKSGTTGAASSISYVKTTSPAAGTDITELMDCAQGDATKSDGFAGETITEALAAIQAKNERWYGLMFTKEMRDDVVVNLEDGVEAAATWCEARVKVFFNTTNDLDVLDSVSTTDIASVLKTSNYRRTMTTFSSYVDEYPSASIAGRAFIVNFNQPDSTITLKFKQGPGISTESITTNQKTVLDSKRANAFIDVGGSTLFAESFMSAAGVFFDEVHGLDWLTEEIQNTVFGYLLTRTTKVPYTDKGLAAIEQQVIRALDRAVRNGLLAPGYTLDGEFLPNGYKTVVIPVAETSQADIEARFYGGLSFVALGAGAIHRVQVDGVFER